MGWVSKGSLKGPKGDKGDAGEQGPQGPAGGFDLTKNRHYSGVGTIRFESKSASGSSYMRVVDGTNGGGLTAKAAYTEINVTKDGDNSLIRVAGDTITLSSSDTNTDGMLVLDSAGAIIQSDKTSLTVQDTVKVGINEVITTADLADEQNLGLVKLANEIVGGGVDDPTAVTPAAVVKYVDAKGLGIAPKLLWEGRWTAPSNGITAPGIIGYRVFLVEGESSSNAKLATLAVRVAEDSATIYGLISNAKIDSKGATYSSAWTGMTLKLDNYGDSLFGAAYAGTTKASAVEVANSFVYSNLVTITKIYGIA